MKSIVCGYVEAHYRIPIALWPPGNSAERAAMLRRIGVYGARA